MKHGETTQVVAPAMDSAKFRRNFLLLIILAWNLPAFVGFGAILLTGVLTPQQVLGILTTPLEPLYIISWQVFVIWFFPRKLRPLADWLNNKATTESATVLRTVRQFPVWYWGLFLLYLVFAAIFVVVFADFYTDFVATPLAHFRVMLVALIVSIIVGLPIFFLIMDLFGRAMGGLVVKRPIITIKTKVFLIGALIPLLIDTMLVQYFWTRTGYFTMETFAVWFVLELLAIGGSLIFVHSFGQSLGPLQTVLRHTEDLSVMDFSLLKSQSTDELGVLSGSYQNLLNYLRLSNMELSTSKAEFEAVFNSISDGVIFADTKRRVILINPAITSMFGYSLPEMKGKETKLLYADPKDYEDQGKKRYRIDADSNLPLYEMQYRRKDQSCFLGETYGTKVIDSDGNVIGLLGIIRDISEKRKSESKLVETQKMLQLVLDTIPVRVFWKDTNCVYLGCNKLFAEDSGLQEPGKLIGKTDFEMGWKEQAELYQSDDRDVMKKGTAKPNYEEPQTTPDGKQIWLETSKIPLTGHAGEVIGILGTYYDITDRKRTEEELRDYREHLEELVAMRTAELESVNRELEAFSYSVSHDLRAPLRAIDGFSQALLEDYNDKLGDEGRDYLRRVRNGTERMALLIDNLLQLSRVGLSRLERTTENITQLAQDIAENMKEQDPERKVQFDIEAGMEANGDQHLLAIVLENLLTNAWKYTCKEASAKITVGKKDQDGKTIFYVTDNGAGFDMQYAGKLFSAFQRLHHDEDFEGTGIGLATVQRIVHLHGGSVWAEAKVDQGASFFFTLGDADAGTSSGPEKEVKYQ